MHIRTSALLLVALPMALGGCDGMTSLQPPGHDGAADIQSLEPMPTRETTSEHIAVLNLNASIDAGRRKFAARIDLGTASELAEQLLLRAELYGSYDDWDEALRISRAVLDAQPQNAEALLLRAQVLSTLHEFDAARALIERARALHSNGEAAISAVALELRASHLEASIERANQEANVDLVARQRRLAIAVPTYQHTTSLALTLAERGMFTEADAVFRSALEHYRDVSPFPFAWVAFQRGVMWSEQAGRPDLGQALYREALRYLPGHVLANVHLAEIEAASGDAQGAIDRLEALVGVTQNPEPLALLATLESSAEIARRYQARADAAYRALLDRFPNAFLHHAPGRL